MSKNLNDQDKLSEDIKSLLFKSQILIMRSEELEETAHDNDFRSYQLIDYIKSTLTELNDIAEVIGSRLHDILEGR